MAEQPTGLDPSSPASAPEGGAPELAAANEQPEARALGSEPAQEEGGHPLRWVPTLYLAESLPNGVVAETSGFLYNDLGIQAAQLGFITGSLQLPWVLKPLWVPLVEMFRTKRWWAVVTQLGMALVFLLSALSLHSGNATLSGLPHLGTQLFGREWGFLVALSSAFETLRALPVWVVGSAASFALLAFLSATHDMAADGFYMLGLSDRQQAAYTGVRTTFYRFGSLIAKGALVALAGYCSASYGKVWAWSLALGAPALYYLFCAFYHLSVMPRPASDAASAAGGDNFLAGYFGSFARFFRKPGLLTALAFMIFFRFGEAQVVAMVAPFLTGPRESGGLGMSTGSVGVAYGTIGVVGLIVGGISAGLLISRLGLRRPYWLMICTMHLPNLLFILLAFTQPDSFALISACLFVEQFGYGFGFTVYTLYLIYFSKGNEQTSHFAICTGLQALSMMLPRMCSGFAKQSFGFHGFFVYIALCTIPSFIVAALAWRDKRFLETYPPATR